MGWYGCCCPDCSIFSDDFNRADGSVGANWTAGAGTWAIASNKLSTSSGSARITSTTAGATDAHVVTVTLRGNTDNDEAIVIVAYTDSSNYLYVLFKFGDGDCGALEFHQVTTGGGDVQLGDTRQIAFPIDTDHRVRVCYQPEVYPNDGRLGVKYADVDASVDVYDFEEVNATGTYVGLGTATVTGTVTFDSFVHEMHAHEDSRCMDCESPRDACGIFSDDFNRSDSTDIGCQWDEYAGAWSISSNVLATSTSSAVALTEIRHPRSTPQSIVQVDAAAPANGDSVKVIVDWFDANNYHYAEFTWGASSAGQLDLVAVSGGIPNTLESINFTHDYTSGGVTLKVCMRPNSIEATATGTGLSENILAETTSNNGRRAGVGTGTASGALTFDDFSWLKHKSDDDPTCEDCATGDYACVNCLNSLQPSHFKLTISGYADSGSCTDVDEEINGTWVLPACNIDYGTGYSAGGLGCDNGSNCSYSLWTDRVPTIGGITICTGVALLQTPVFFEVVISRPVSNTVITVNISNGQGLTPNGPSHVYEYTFPGTDLPDCTAIDGLVIPWKSNNVTGPLVTDSTSAQNATITLTAL